MKVYHLILIVLVLLVLGIFFWMKMHSLAVRCEEGDKKACATYRVLDSMTSSD